MNFVYPADASQLDAFGLPETIRFMRYRSSGSDNSYICAKQFIDLLIEYRWSEAKVSAQYLFQQ